MLVMCPVKAARVVAKAGEAARVQLAHFSKGATSRPGDSPPFRSRSERQHPPRIPRLSPVPPGEESPGIGGGACQKNRLEQQSALRLRCGETCVRRAPLVPDTHFAAALSTPVLVCGGACRRCCVSVFLGRKAQCLCGAPQAAFDGDDDGRLLRKLDIPE
ncbi:hypothetical protein MRX96_032035 [Rhipicephalus microplus]